jgi:hypothetical protein
MHHGGFSSGRASQSILNAKCRANGQNLAESPCRYQFLHSELRPKPEIPSSNRRQVNE